MSSARANTNAIAASSPGESGSALPLPGAAAVSSYSERRVLLWVCLSAAVVALPNLTLVFNPKFEPRNFVIFCLAAGLVLLPCLLRLPVRWVLLAWLPLVLLLPAVTAYQLV